MKGGGTREWTGGGVKVEAPGGGASDTLAHAEQQLYAQGDARVPAQRQDAQVARHDGRPQQVLH